jgi:hypothetical protein
MMMAVLANASQNTASAAAMPGGPLGMEHRFGQRFRCGTAVRVSSGSSLTGRGRLVNVSLSGAFLETALDLPLLATISIARDGNCRRDVELLASVVRKDACGVGVEWCENLSSSICEIFGCSKRCEVA